VAELGLLERLERLERRNAIAPAPPTAQDSVAEADDAAAETRRTFERPSVREPDVGPADQDGAVDGAVDAAAGLAAAGPAIPASAESPARASAPVMPAPAAEPPPTATTPPSDGPAAPGPPATSPSEPPNSGLDAAAVRRVWPEVLAAAKERKKRTAALLVSATVRAIERDTLVLSIGTAPLARLLSEQSNTEVIAESLHAVLGVRWRVRCEHGDGDPSGPAPARGAATTPPPAPPTPPRRPTRPPPARRSTAPDDGTPLPPEPPDEDAPPDDEEAMLAEAAAGAAATPVALRDPEEAAIELLSTQLGARAIDRS
jgi:DNA polymerase III subunit gamma/tau